MSPTATPVSTLPSKTVVLFVQYGKDWLSGQERAMLTFAQALDRDRYQPMVWSNSRAVDHECARLGIPSIYSEMAYYGDFSSPALSVRQYWRQARQAYQLIRQHKVGIVHCNGAAPSQWITPVCRLLRVKVLVHLHTNYFKRSRYVTLLHFANAVIGCSKQVLEPLQRDALGAPKLIRHVYNGIAPEVSDGAGNRADADLGNGVLHFLFVGSLQRHKGLDVALEALATVSSRLPPWRLTVAGDGEELGALQAQTVALGLADRVHFCGRLPAVAPLYAEGDILLLPSRQEGFALVAIEAAAHGIPCIGTRVGGVPEAVLDEQTGLLVESDDPRAFGEALLRLAHDRGLHARLGGTARLRTHQNFLIASRVAELQSIYRELVPRS